jgi:ATP-binding cassette subfamily F protein 3
MAVLIASAIDKDIAGAPLFRGVSFKLERRERMTLAGRNGSGKTTLLRCLAGEAAIDGGELAFAKGTRVVLHDQRPPRERDVTLRDYVLSGCSELIAVEQELSKLEQAMAEATRASARSSATPTRRRGSKRPAATAGASTRWGPSTASASPTSSSTAR